MAATAWGTVVGALVARMQARTGYRDGWAASAVAGSRMVLDSVEVGLVADHAGQFLIVGWPGDPDAPAEAGQSGQVVATLGTSRIRQEDGDIHCLAIDQRGDVGPGVVAASRAAALSVLDDVDAELRADPTLGLQGSGPGQLQSLSARIGDLPSIRPFLSAGVVTWVEFTVVFSARI